jgi:cell division protease FtsH
MGPQGNENRQSSGMPGWIWLILIFLMVAWGLPLLLGGGEQGTPLPYTEFRQQLEQGNIERITVTGEEVRGEFRQPLEDVIPETGATVETSEFVTYLPSFGDEGLFALLQQQNVEVVTNPVSTFSWGMIFLNMLPFILLIGIAIFYFRNMRSQGESVFSMGKSRAKIYNRSQERTTFDDVAGAAGAKQELQEIIEYLRNPMKFQQLGGQIPKGVLLVGPPGTGKTLLARAVAGEAGVPFFSITGSDFMEMFVGVGASRVRELFREAKENSPAIIFIDELDSVGRQRGAGVGGGHDEREQTLNQMLSEMDGFEKNESVIVMAATNRPDILDSALLRPGRFDRQVTVDLPTRHDRLEILKVHSRNKPMGPDVDLDEIARGTPLFSGADLENLLNESALLAARRDKDSIGRTEIDEARDKVILGLKRENMQLTEGEYRMLAYHEAGHAVVAAIVPNSDPIHKVTIVPRGRAMGVMQQLPERDRYLYPIEYMLDRLAVMMGGRAAEELIFQTATSGAENDLKEATKLAKKMVLDWGMSKKLRHIALGSQRDQVFLGEEITQRREYSESTAREVDEEIRSILEEAYNRAVEILRDHREGLDRIVDALMEREDIPGSEVLEKLNLVKTPSPVQAG